MDIDLKIFKTIYSLSSASKFFDACIRFISGPFSYVVLPALFLVYVCTFAKNKMYFFALTTLSAISAWLIANMLKMAVMRLRPFESLSQIIPLTRPDGYSFPSQHSTVFATLTVIAFHLDVRFGYVMLFLTLLIGFSRIVAGVHYPLDVIAGFILGGIVGYSFVFFFKKYV